MSSFVKVKVHGLALDSSDSPLVLLEAEDGRRLPIWIGVFEATAIQIVLEGAEVSRPLTHDLMASAIETLGAEISAVRITQLEESTFIAELVLRLTDGSEQRLDARPSDAIALALRAEAEILVAAAVMEVASVTLSESDEDRVRKELEDFDPDVEKYTM